MKLLKKISILALVGLMAMTPIIGAETKLEYVNGKVTSIIEQEINVSTDGYAFSDDMPVIDGIIYIDFMDLAGLLGFQTNYLEDGQLIGIDYDNKYDFKFTIGDRGGFVNGNHILLPSAPILYTYEQKAYVPFEATVEALGESFAYHASTDTYTVGEPQQAGPIASLPVATTVYKTNIHTTEPEKSVVNMIGNAMKLEDLAHLVDYSISYYRGGNSFDLEHPEGYNTLHISIANPKVTVIDTSAEQKSKLIFSLPNAPMRIFNSDTMEAEVYVPLNYQFMSALGYNYDYDNTNHTITISHNGNYIY